MSYPSADELPCGEIAGVHAHDDGTWWVAACSPDGVAEEHGPHASIGDANRAADAMLVALLGR